MDAIFDHESTNSELFNSSSLIYIHCCDFSHTFTWLDCRIPGPLIYISLNKNITIVIYLVLQSTPTHVNKWAGYSAIAPFTFTVPSLPFLKLRGIFAHFSFWDSPSERRMNILRSSEQGVAPEIRWMEVSCSCQCAVKCNIRGVC